MMDTRPNKYRVNKFQKKSKPIRKQTTLPVFVHKATFPQFNPSHTQKFDGSKQRREKLKIPQHNLAESELFFILTIAKTRRITFTCRRPETSAQYHSPLRPDTTGKW